MKRAAPAFFALHPNAAVHHLDQSAGDGQTETSAAKSPGEGAVHLREGLEDQGLLLRWDADPGVAYRKLQGVRAIGRALNGDRDFAPIGEFNRVAHQIDQNLPEPPGIAAHPRRHIRCHPAYNIQPFDIRRYFQALQHAENNIA
ncbi:MAG: hypothetical protein WBE37_12675 [Bryobacteraceae bacterium]